MTFSGELLAFARELRERHGFRVGPGEVRDASLALELVDLASVTETRDALRPVLASSREQARRFDALFDAFFFPKPPLGTAPKEVPKAVPQAEGEDANSGDADAEAPLRESSEALDDASESRRFLQARFSPLAAAGEAPGVRSEDLAEMLAAASRLVGRLRLGRGRRWAPMPRGTRLDVRRTLRASLARGGEFVAPRWQGHPRRDPRFVLVLDGSRSMSAHAARALQFAYALAVRTRRVEVFFFSTELRRATPELRRLVRAGRVGTLPSFGAAWGGGTDIGTSLAALVRHHGDVLTRDTLVFVLSDGLDVGEPRRLERAMREMARRSAGIVWLNPLLSTPGYAPSARGMRAALPHVAVFAPAGDLAEYEILADRLTLSR